MERFLTWCVGPDTAHALSDFAITDSELQVVQLSTDVDGQREQPVHLLTKQDPLEEVNVPSDGSGWKGSARMAPMTPRQRTIRDRVQLPYLRRYPLAPGCTQDQSEEARQRELLRVYQDFVLDLHKGFNMTQLTSNQDYSLIHCQILEDLQTLKVDQGSGCIIEFPLDAVSKVYRIVKSDDKWYNANVHGSSGAAAHTEHIVVVEFRKRKLAFVFADLTSASSFLLCMELLIRRAQEVRVEVNNARAPSRRKDISPMFSGANVGKSRDANSARGDASQDLHDGGNVRPVGNADYYA
eukprot:TRINITY_DN15948_c0_g1_i2.p1 TRINITY_DN15948_c0_g1~~TRINITY_DN15948_c0_g1_i2.p1  ORF type:complete len:296 (-),score=45.92 TRINITY_DN15948_c0_g1_i2:39-926(-)